MTTNDTACAFADEGCTCGRPPLTIADATELDALRADIDDRDSEISTLRSDLDLQTKAAWDNNAKVAELTAELAKVRDQLTAANHRADGLAADVRTLEQAQTAYANENARLHGQLDSVWRRVTELTTEKEETQEYLDRLHYRLNEADAVISAAQAWRDLHAKTSGFEASAGTNLDRAIALLHEYSKACGDVAAAVDALKAGVAR